MKDTAPLQLLLLYCTRPFLLIHLRAETRHTEYPETPSQTLVLQAVAQAGLRLRDPVSRRRKGAPTARSPPKTSR